MRDLWSVAVADPGFPVGGHQPRRGPSSPTAYISKNLCIEIKESGPSGGTRRLPLGFTSASESATYFQRRLSIHNGYFREIRYHFVITWFRIGKLFQEDPQTNGSGSCEMTLRWNAGVNWQEDVLVDCVLKSLASYQRLKQCAWCYFCHPLWTGKRFSII